MDAMPSLFVSHGAPNLVLQDIPARSFLSGYAANLPRPAAILICSAHFEADLPAVVTDPHPGMIYDFGGFERELYALKYPASGSPDVAERVIAAIDKAGIEVAGVAQRGFDHGAWVPLMLLFPAADIPVVQLSVVNGSGASGHYRLGAALSGLRDEGILVIGSGSFTHNLHEAFTRMRHTPQDNMRPDWVAAFVDWMESRIAAGAVDDLLGYRDTAPFAVENHPTDEHLMPLYVALGAAGSQAKAERVHQSHQYGVLQLDAFAFH
jgi:4,5-DOPA dioxygenase extradiol